MDCPGALVISIDFELLWGVRDIYSRQSMYAQQNILGVRKAIPALLELFSRYRIGATWAVVGMLCSRDRDELTRSHPPCRPDYHNESLSPYAHLTGLNEADDPLHFGGSLVRMIQEYSEQELASHTYSHYYCLEPGQDEKSFHADCLAFSAVAERYGIVPRTIILPRNQWNPAYADILLSHGIFCFRGNQNHWAYTAASSAGNNYKKRLTRLADTYLPICGDHSFGWEAIPQPDGTCNVPASFFLRPVNTNLLAIERLRLKRLTSAMTRAAQHGRVVHLWFHPHNYGVNTEASLAFLQQILQHWQSLSSSYGFKSMTMLAAAEQALSVMNESGL